MNAAVSAPSPDDEQVFVAVEIEVARRDAHAAFGSARRIQRGAGQQAVVGERAVVPIDPQLVRRAVVGDVDVEPAVAVVVAHRDAEPRAVRLRDAGRGGAVDEASTAVVAKQPGGHGAIRARAAVVARARRVVALLVGRRREVDVVRDEEIERAVAVVVEERGAGAPSGIREARLLRDVGERAVAVVVKERQRAERRDEQILVAVVVVVADRGAHAVSAQSDSRGLRDVRETQRAPAIGANDEIVAEET